VQVDARRPRRLVRPPPARALDEVVAPEEGLVVRVVVEGADLLFRGREGDRLDVIPVRVQPRHLLLRPVARVPPRHLGLDVRDEGGPRAADDGVRALRARDAEVVARPPQPAPEQLDEVPLHVAARALAAEDAVLTDLILI